MVPAAMLDACVLYPISLRDTLLNVAEAGLFRVLWTEEILTETARNIVRDTPGLTMEHLEKTFAAMRRAFPDAMISGYEPLIEAMTNHSKDRHVLAAAVAAQADVVVTANLRHFPPQSGNPHGIRIESPDQFLCDAMQRQPDVVAAALRAQAARKRHPPMSADEMLDRLAITVPNFAAAARSLVHA
ncbi:MAG: PIN domain-containing protein [Pseudonocardiaceae bacterium]